MARRMFDTNELSSPYIRGLGGAYKLLYLYLKRICDHAGVCWDIELDIAELRCGFEYGYEECVQNLGTGIIVFGGGRNWYLPDFLFDQHGKNLNWENKVHKSAIQILQKNDLLKIFYERGGAVKGLASPLLGDIDTYKDKEIVIAKEEKGGAGEKTISACNGPALQDVEFFFMGAGGDVEAAKKFWEYHEGLGWKKGITPIVNWRSFANIWIADNHNNKTKNNGTSTNRRDFTGNVSPNGAAGIHE